MLQAVLVDENRIVVVNGDVEERVFDNCEEDGFFSVDHLGWNRECLRYLDLFEIDSSMTNRPAPKVRLRDTKADVSG